MTWPLVTRANSKKFGKSEQGDVWLDPGADDAVRVLPILAEHDGRRRNPDAGAQFTFLPVGQSSEIARDAEAAPERREAQRVLAREVTELVHGKAMSESAERTSAVLFDANGDFRKLSDAELRSAFAGSPLLEEIDKERVGTKAGEFVGADRGGGAL